MAFFSKLFRGPSPDERMRKAKAMIADGELGLARIELQGVVAVSDLAPDDRRAAEALLVDCSDRLAGARLDEAAALAAAGDVDAAEELLDVVAEIGPTPALAARLDAMRAELVGRRFQPALTPGGIAAGAASTAELASLARGGQDGGIGLGAVIPRLQEPARAAVGPDDHDDPHGPDADDHDGLDHPDAGEVASELTPYEQALLAFSPDEGDRWDDLAAADPEVGAALAAQGAGEIAEAVSHWQAAAGASQRDPLVQRELGRALLLHGEHAAALPVLEKAHAADPDSETTMELLADARLLAGDPAGAAELASRLLDAGPGPSFAALLDVLVKAGRGDEALRHVELAIGRHQTAIPLWEVRGNLGHGLGRADVAAESDERGLRLFREQCVSCGGRPPYFPVRSAERVFEAELVAPRGRAKMARDQLIDLARLLAANDPERREHWRARLAALAPPGGV